MKIMIKQLSMYSSKSVRYQTRGITSEIGNLVAMTTRRMARIPSQRLPMSSTGSKKVAKDRYTIIAMYATTLRVYL